MTCRQFVRAVRATVRRIEKQSSVKLLPGRSR
jgi:hypothetical protein